MRILGLDPGTAVTGWGVIGHGGNKSRLVAHGTIVTSARQPPHERLSEIYQGVLEAIRIYQPEAAAIEELFGGVNLKTALAVGQARGVLVLACAESGVIPADYTPLRIKQAVVGYGRASKVQVQQMIKALLGLDKVPKPDHAADALAVAICHAHSMKSNFQEGRSPVQRSNLNSVIARKEGIPSGARLNRAGASKVRPGKGT